jgi:hypothetical protein
LNLCNKRLRAQYRELTILAREHNDLSPAALRGMRAATHTVDAKQ